MNTQTNIDDVRAEIMRLEAAPHFDAVAWSRVLADLEAASRFSALADAQRRMDTARSNQPLKTVAVETVRVLRKDQCRFCSSRKCYTRIVTPDLQFDEVACRRHTRCLALYADRELRGALRWNIDSTGNLKRGVSLEKYEMAEA